MCNSHKQHIFVAATEMQASDSGEDNEQGDNSNRGEALQLHTQHESAPKKIDLPAYGIERHSCV